MKVRFYLVYVKNDIAYKCDIVDNYVVFQILNYKAYYKGIIQSYYSGIDFTEEEGIDVKESVEYYIRKSVVLINTLINLYSYFLFLDIKNYV